MTTRSDNSLLRIIVIVVAVLLLVPLLMMFSFPMMGMMGWWGSTGPNVGLSPFWGIGMMLVFLLVACCMCKISSPDGAGSLRYR